jgi:hypothetical protein
MNHNIRGCHGLPSVTLVFRTDVTIGRVYPRRIFYFFGTATVTSEAISIRVTVSECIIWQNTRYIDGKAVRR